MTVSILALSRVLHAYADRHRRRSVALLVAYIDESGTHAQSQTVHMAGFVAASAEWEKIESEWVALLGGFEVPYYHATECETGHGIYSGMNRSLRELLTCGLARILAKYKPMGINVGISRADWNDFTDGVLHRIYEDPYSLCFEFCMQKIGIWSQKYASGEAVALMFGEQEEFSAVAQRLYGLYRNRSQWSANISTFTYGCAKKIPALQAADLFAYEANKYRQSQLLGKPSPLRPGMKIMVDAEMQAVEGDFDPLSMAIV